MQAAKDFKVGQKWKTRDGTKIFTIETVLDCNSNYPIEAGNYQWDKCGNMSYGKITNLDLVELIEDAVCPEEQTNDKYSVEEVMDAFNSATGLNYSNFIPEIEKHLKKIKDPEYQKYLELKAKFE